MQPYKSSNSRVRGAGSENFGNKIKKSIRIIDSVYSVRKNFQFLCEWRENKARIVNLVELGVENKTRVRDRFDSRRWIIRRAFRIVIFRRVY